MRIVRQNATLCEVEIGERLKSTFTCEKWNLTFHFRSYFFRSWDVENGLPLDDFSYKMVLNTACSPAKVPEKLKAFYEYINDPKKSQASELTRMIDERVRKFNSGEWRRKYMTFEQILNERERKSFAQGHAEGVAQEKREIAKKFRQAGIPIEVIAENTGLSAEEIENL